jgi:hypothetical protein
MPLYSFAVHNSHRRIESEASELLPDDGAAFEETVGIVRDLKKNNAALWRNGWTIEVTEGDPPRRAAPVESMDGGLSAPLPGLSVLWEPAGGWVGGFAPLRRARRSRP